MLFNSIDFLFIFLPIVFIGYFLCNKFKLYTLGKLWLALASLFFYAYYNIQYLSIIISSVVFNYSIGLLLQKEVFPKLNNRVVLTFAILVNLLLLSYYKYFDFLIQCFNNIANAQFNTMHLLLPLGISFFTFQQLSYIVDCYKKEVKNTNFIDYVLFVTFFPQLIAGPIIHHEEIIPQFEDMSKKRINHENIAIGLFFITIGLVKKVLLADSFSPFIQRTITNVWNLDFLNSWFFALSVGCQGYFDFSGYCDMAIGIGMLFNITLPINFNSPYKAIDISDYWRRWHITLGKFLKNYVYIPLGGSRVGEFNTYRNLFIVFFLTGVWHGANWPCVTYGVVNALLVCVNKFWKSLNININKKLAILITFTTMIFIAPLVIIKTMPQYFKVLTSMVGFNTHFTMVTLDGLNMKFYNGSSLDILLIGISLFILFGMQNSSELAKKYVATKSLPATILLAILFIVSTLSLNQVTEFIYFQF